MQQIPNPHIARSVTRNLLNIVGTDSDYRFKHTFINTVTPAHWAHRWFYGSKVRPEKSYQLTVNGRSGGTLKDALVEWAKPERLDYDHDYLGIIEADKRTRLGELPDTLLVDLSRWYFNVERNRMDIVTDPVNVPITLNCADLGNVLAAPSEVQYNLMAFQVGQLRRRTPDDNYVLWRAYIRVPGSDQWHVIDRSPLAEGLQYPTQRSLPTNTILDLLTGGNVLGEFCMKAWYQKADVTVHVTTPSVAAWEESWQEDAEFSVGMDNPGGRGGEDVAVGIPIELAAFPWRSRSRSSEGG